jgi:hypothetical protein
MMQQIQPYQLPQPYPQPQVEPQFAFLPVLQGIVFVLLAIGMVAYFFKKGPAAFFEETWKE